MSSTNWSVLGAYLWPGKPYMPELEGTYDSIAVQAFGRVSYTDDEVGGKVNDLLDWAKESAGRLYEHEAMQLLDENGFNPSLVNNFLAQEAINRHRRFPAPVYAQWENAFAMYKTDKQWFEQQLAFHQLFICWPPRQGYLATYGVLESAYKLGSKKPYLVGQPAHIARIVLTAWAVGMRPVVEGFQDPEDNWLWIWDECSIQPWTRNFNAWRKREMPVRGISLALHLLPILYKLAPKGVRAKLPAPNWLALSPPK